MDPITIFSAFVPLLVQGGKAMINKWLGQSEFKPASIEEFIKIKDKDLELYKAINSAGGTNQSYSWVEAIIRLQRPTVVVAVLLAWVYAHYMNVTDTSAVDNATAIVSFYLFGERSMLYWKKTVE